MQGQEWFEAHMKAQDSKEMSSKRICGSTKTHLDIPAGNFSRILAILPHFLVTHHALGVVPPVPDVVALELPMDPLQGWLHPVDLHRGAGFIEEHRDVQWWRGRSCGNQWERS